MPITEPYQKGRFVFQGMPDNLFSLVLEMTAAVFLTAGYLVLRSTFNLWDRDGEIRIENKECCRTGLFFYFFSVLLLGRAGLGSFLMSGMNIICLAFLAFIDARTKQLYIAVIYLLAAVNGTVFLFTCLFGRMAVSLDMVMAVSFSYLAVVGMLCITRAVAAGDGAIMAVMLPVLLMLEKDDGFRTICMVMLNLLIPLFSFVIAEGIKTLLKRFGHKQFCYCENLRKPFAPYLLLGFTMTLILDISSR